MAVFFFCVVQKVFPEIANVCIFVAEFLILTQRKGVKDSRLKCKVKLITYR